MIKLFINGTECKDFDWKDFSININRDRDNRIVRVTMPQKTTLRGDAYAVVRSAFSESGWCATLPVVIQKSCGGGYKDLVNGLIFLNDCEFRTQMCEVDVPIRDDSFYSKLFNNSKIEYYTASAFSKNREPLAVPTPIDIEFFYPPSGAYNSGFVNSGTRKCYDWGDLMTYMMKFVSDDTFTFVSDWYDALPSTKRLAIVTAKELRLASGVYKDFRISLKDLTSDIFKHFNLWTHFNGYNYHVEEREYYYASTSQFNLGNVKSVTQLALQEEYFSNVKVGTYNATNTLDETFAVLRYFTFIEENYYVEGVCNINNELNLLGEKFICDSNLIEQLLVNNIDDFDDDLFLVEYDTSTMKATKTYNIGDATYYYNDSLLNSSVLERYSFNGGLYAVTNETSDRFNAAFPSDTVPAIIDTGAGTVVVNGVPTTMIFDFAFDVYPDPLTSYAFPVFSNDSVLPYYDTDNRFNNATNVYTAPISGFYTFQINWKASITSATGTLQAHVAYYWLLMVLTRSTQGDVTTYFTTANGVVPEINTFVNTAHDLYGTITTYLEAGETVTPKYKTQRIPPNPYDVFYEYNDIVGNWVAWADSTFACVMSPDAGGEYKASDLTSFKSSLFRFDQKLTDSQVTALLDSPGNAFTFDEGDGIEKKVWINDITINIKDNFASIEAISDIANS